MASPIKPFPKLRKGPMSLMDLVQESKAAQAASSSSKVSSSTARFGAGGPASSSSSTAYDRRVAEANRKLEAMHEHDIKS